MNKLKSHTRNQRRMYRIHKQEEKIHNLELLIGFLQQENQELKKQLEKKYEKASTLTGELLYEENTKLINQQKEFIEWLENKIKERDNDIKLLGNDCYTSKYGYKESLSKYKEIIRGRNGN